MARVLVLVPTTSYRTDDFLVAAGRLGVEAVVGTDRCHVLAEEWPAEAFGGSWPLDFRHLDEAAAQIARAARAQPLDAIVATDETTARVAARAAVLLGLPGNAASAIDRAGNKATMRAALHAAAVPAPRAQLFSVDAEPETLAVSFPCVVKPLLLSASRGVIRADDRASFLAAWQRVVALLSTPRLKAEEDPAGRQILVEEFVPGAEVAVEGLMQSGALTPLALFDKPDPLDGPFFEETIYVTPSRLAPAVQAEVFAVAERAARALGLSSGPIHAELRLPPAGPTVIEVAARSIGGLCARTLRFGLGGETSLEELVLRHALGRPLPPLAPREGRAAAGVLMLPIPGAGVLKAVGGVEAARAVPLVEDVLISARPGEVLVPLPEGASYPGFVFARGETPAAVEAALRAAERLLVFDVAPTLPTT